MKFLVLAALFVVGDCFYPGILNTITPLKSGLNTRRNNDMLVDRLFRIADSNRNDYLDADELSEVIQPDDGTSSLEKAAQLIRRGDYDGDFNLNREEMLSVLDELSY